MGATFGPSRAIAVLLAAAMALVGLSFVGTPASSEDAISFQFSVAGDFGSWSGFRESLDQLNASGSDFALALGDLSYGGNTGYANTTEEAWCSKFHKFFPKIEIIAGNHDTGDTIAGEGNINQFIAYCPFNIKTSVDGVYGKQYAFDFPRNNPLARFILISPDLVFRVDDGEHYSYDVGTPRYDGKYQRGDGSVVVIQGTGGREIDDFNQSDPTAGYFAAYMATDTVGAANGVVTYSVYPDRLEERTSFNGTYADGFTIGEFTPGLFERVLQVLPIAAPVVVGLVGFGVGGFLVWRNRQATPRPRVHRVRDFRL